MTTQKPKPRPIILSRDPQSAAGRLAALKPQKPAEQTVTETAARYMAAVRRSLPDLEHAELCLVFDALGPEWTADEESAQTLTAEIIDAIDKDRLDQKWAVTGSRFANRIKRLPYAAQMALSELNEMFWIHCEHHQDYDAAVKACLELLQPAERTQPVKRPARLSPEKAGGSVNPPPPDHPAEEPPSPDQTDGHHRPTPDEPSNAAIMTPLQPAAT